MPARHRRTPPRPTHDELALPPLDGDDGDVPAPLEDLEHTIVVHDTPLDDALSENLDAEESWTPDEVDGWLDDAAGDAAARDDATDADEIDAGDGASWLADDGDLAAREADDELLESPSAARDDLGDEGPAGDESDPIGEAGPLDGDDDDDEDHGPIDDATMELSAGAPPVAGFALPTPANPPALLVEIDGAVLAAAVGTDECVLVGDGVWTARLASLAAALAGDRALATKRGAVVLDADEVLTSVVTAGGRRFVAASVAGRVLRSEDSGLRWEPVAALGGQDAGVAAVELYGEAAGGRGAVRLWARAHGGGLFRSEDVGAQWDGPVLPTAVRALAIDARGGAALAATSGRAHELLRTGDGVRWEPRALTLHAAPALLASCGDVVAAAFARGPGLVSADSGESAASWELLDGATAIAVVETDDGATQLLIALYHEASDRATIVAARIGPDGGPRGARRIADVDVLLPRAGEAVDDAPESRVEAIVPLDAAGRRILVITPRGVVAFARDSA